MLELLPIPGELLRAKFCGLYIIEKKDEKKVNYVHYIACAPDRREKQEDVPYQYVEGFSCQR